MNFLEVLEEKTKILNWKKLKIIQIQGKNWEWERMDKNKKNKKYILEKYKNWKWDKMRMKTQLDMKWFWKFLKECKRFENLFKKFDKMGEISEKISKTFLRDSYWICSCDSANIPLANNTQLSRSIMDAFFRLPLMC